MRTIEEFLKERYALFGKTDKSWEMFKETQTYKHAFAAIFDYAHEIVNQCAHDAKLRSHSCGDSMMCACGGQCDHPVYHVDRKSIHAVKELIK